MKDILIVDIDYSASKPEFKKVDMVDIATIPGYFVVPEEGPFYEDTLRIEDGGTLLQPTTDYVILDPVPDLTQKTGKGVSLYIELKQHVIDSATTLKVTYQKVGNPVINRKKLIELLEDLVINGKPIDFPTQIEGLPETYYPAWHSHDIQNPDEMIGFGDMMQLFIILGQRELAAGNQVQAAMERMQTAVYDRLNYIQRLQWGYIMNHSRDVNNPHGLRASEVELGNVANYATATPQQDAEGQRSDLYSTPAGLKRILENSEPDSESFIMQNELPFSYYGSGIYLPPPITGSFEGLGGDLELGAFCLEGNGWTVGLVRAYDGRVKNLYFIYDQEYPGLPNYGLTWKCTYVQYQHPVITAAGSNPNVVISGSDQEILMLGNGDAHLYWACLANSTFDPTKHDLKPIDMSEVDAAGLRGHAAGKSNIFRMGDWVYYVLWGNPPAGFDLGGPNIHVENAAGYWFRMPYSDLANPNVRSLKWTKIKTSNDTLQRDRRTNTDFMILDLGVQSSPGVTTRYIANIVPAAVNVLSHRRRAMIAMGNPNDKTKGKIRILMHLWTTYRDPTGLGVSKSTVLITDWNFDVTTNTLTLDPRWVRPTFNPSNGVISGLTPEQGDRIVSGGAMTGLCVASQVATTSKIPGFGTMTYASWGDGGPPYISIRIRTNPTGDPQQDWEHFDLPYNQKLPSGQPNAWNNMQEMKSPYGVSAYPRHYCDLYHYNGKVNATPLEIFMAIDELSNAKGFYRECEPGDGTKYLARTKLNSPYLGPLIGRDTNSRFGLAPHALPWGNFVSSPRTKNEFSRQYGNFHVADLNMQDGHRRVFSNFPGPQGNLLTIAPVGGYLRVPLLCNHTVEYGVLSTKQRDDYLIDLPLNVWEGYVKNAIGAADYAKCIDVIADWYIAPLPGLNVCPSFVMINYHTTDEPKRARGIIARFWWTKGANSPNGKPTLQMTNIDYPFTASTSNAALRPGPDNTVIAPQNDGFAYNPNGSWAWGYQGAYLTTGNVQILAYPEEGPNSFEIKLYPGWRIGTTGYSATPDFTYVNRVGKPGEAYLKYPSTGSWVSYMTYQMANPEWGWCTGRSFTVSGGAMNLMTIDSDTSKTIMAGATYVEGNWALFITTAVTVTFNGRSILANPRAMDIRDFATVYKNQTFYLYCTSLGSAAEYELSRELYYPSGERVLVATIKTDDFGITQIERDQRFSISGFPLTRDRDTGIPVSSGSLTERGSYRFLKRSELFNG